MCFNKLWKFNLESFHFGASKFHQSLRFQKHRILLYSITLYKDFRPLVLTRTVKQRVSYWKDVLCV